jgi:cytochrome c oxidase subunit 2
MSLRTVAGRPTLRWLPVTLLVALVLTGCAENYPQTTLLPRGDFARLADHLFRTTVFWATIVFVLVEGALVFAMWRFRARPGAGAPAQTHGNTTLEIVWTIIPAFILAMIAVPTIRTIFQMAKEPGPDAVQVEVIGHQWWWEFRYPKLGIITANELHVPVGQTVNLRMTTNDVVHSFWVPQFAAKRDVFANRHNNLWFKAEAGGTYSGQCAEFCGIQHGRMAYRIVAEDSTAFQTWAANFNKPPDSTTADSLVLKGKALFTSKGCVGCHSIGQPAIPGLIGPNLAHVGSRQYIAAGWLKNSDENLARWLHNPQAVKQGVLMPNLGLTDDEVKSLIAWLRYNK